MIPHDAWPVDPGSLGPFLIAVALVEITPGPNMAYLAALSMAQGRAAGLRAVAGVTVGLSVYMLASVAGVAGAVAAAPTVYGALRWAGVAYLLWLAIEAWRGAEETSPGLTSVSGPFWRGLVANLLNPKAAVFYITLLPGFISPGHGSFARQAVVLGGVHILVSIIVHGAIVIAAARASGFVQRGRILTVRRSLAVGIAFVAFWLFWETRQ